MPWIVEQVEQTDEGNRLILVGDDLPALTERPITVVNYGSVAYEWTSSTSASPEIRTKGGTTYTLGTGTSGSGTLVISDTGGPSVLDLVNAGVTDFYIRLDQQESCVEGGGSGPVGDVAYNDADGLWYANLSTYGGFVSIDPVDVKASGNIVPNNGYLDTSGAATNSQIAFVLDKPADQVILEYVTIETATVDHNVGTIIVSIDGADYAVPLDDTNRRDNNLGGTNRNTYYKRFGVKGTVSDGATLPQVQARWTGAAPSNGEVRVWVVLRYFEEVL